MVKNPIDKDVVRRREAEILKVVTRHGWSYVQTRLSPGPIKSAQEAAAAENPSLPLPQVLAQVLTELGPTYVKLGQLLSTRPDLLSSDYIEALESLQSNVPPVPWEEIKPQLEADLGTDISEVFAEFEEKVIAAGSLGQIYRAQLPDGQTVAVKVQRPGIRNLIEADLQGLQTLVERFKNRQLGKTFDLQGLLDEFSTSILSELDFRREARNTIEMGENLDQSHFWSKGEICVPKVYSEWSSERVLVLEWVEGTPILKAELPSNQRVQVARWVAQMLLNQFFIDGFFHADPHPGNFFYHSNEKDYHLILLDCGMVSRLDPRTRNILLDLFVGIIDANPRQMAQALYDVGYTREAVNIAAMENEVDRVLRSNYTRALSELKLAELIQEILDIPRRNHIQLPGTIGLFIKALTNAEGVARSLDPDFSFIEVGRPVMKRASRQRYFSPARLQETTYKSVLALDSLSGLPQRLDSLFDRLEVSELSLSWTWREQNKFQQTLNRGVRRLSLALLSVGAIGSGALLVASKSQAASTISGYTLFWGNSLLIGGLAIALWLVFEFIVRPEMSNKQ